MQAAQQAGRLLNFFQQAEHVGGVARRVILIQAVTPGHHQAGCHGPDTMQLHPGLAPNQDHITCRNALQGTPADSHQAAWVKERHHAGSVDPQAKVSRHRQTFQRQLQHAS